MSYTKELHIALLAVQRATLLTRKVFREKAKATISKDDKSPVTIGDFGAQALIIHAIRHNFPRDEIVGEEEARSLRQDQKLAEQIWALVRETRLDEDAEAEEEAEEELGGPVPDLDAMLTAIDAGNSAGGARGRVWALDPIDGTKGFLRGGQYAVCLALIEDGDVKVGVLGCPNLPVDDSARMPADLGAHHDGSTDNNDDDDDERGVIFSAIKGAGATSRPLGRGMLRPSQAIHVRPLTDLTQASFCESVEAAHSSHGDQARIAAALGITRPSVRMDSQAKYGSVARGAGDVYLRLPVSATYVEKIWDHAAGDLIVREAGGEVTDARGARLDFGKGRTLAGNRGVVASPKGVHGLVLEAVRSVVGSI